MTGLRPFVVYSFEALSMYRDVVAAGKIDDMQVTTVYSLLTCLGPTVLDGLPGISKYGGVVVVG